MSVKKLSVKKIKMLKGGAADPQCSVTNRKHYGTTCSNMQ
jgi:hypothetical protein